MSQVLNIHIDVLNLIISLFLGNSEANCALKHVIQIILYHVLKTCFFMWTDDDLYQFFSHLATIICVTLVILLVLELRLRVSNIMIIIMLIWIPRMRNLNSRLKIVYDLMQLCDLSLLKKTCLLKPARKHEYVARKSYLPFVTMFSFVMKGHILSWSD